MCVARAGAAKRRGAMLFGPRVRWLSLPALRPSAGSRVRACSQPGSATQAESFLATALNTAQQQTADPCGARSHALAVKARNVTGLPSTPSQRVAAPLVLLPSPPPPLPAPPGTPSHRLSCARHRLWPSPRTSRATRAAPMAAPHATLRRSVACAAAAERSRPASRRAAETPSPPARGPAPPPRTGSARLIRSTCARGRRRGKGGVGGGGRCERAGVKALRGRSAHGWPGSRIQRAVAQAGGGSTAGRLPPWRCQLEGRHHSPFGHADNL